MVIRVRRWHIAFVIAASILLVTATAFTLKLQSSSVEAITVFENQSSRDKVLVLTFLSKIEESSNAFYAPYYTLNPTIAFYDTTVKDVDEKDGLIYITFNTTPYIGPHDEIGEDEITFSISHTGEIVQEDFRHLKSYHLPENLKSIEKGLLPEEEY